MFLRGTVFWGQNNETAKQESLGTKDRAIAERLLHAKNEAYVQPSINLQIARAYLMVSHPQFATRTWAMVMREILVSKGWKPKEESKENSERKSEPKPEAKLVEGAAATLRRWLVAVEDKALDGSQRPGVRARLCRGLYLPSG